MNNETENSMVLGLGFEESTYTPEPEFDRSAFIDQVTHDFPLDVRIKGLLAEIDETCRVPVQETIDVLHAMLAYYATNMAEMAQMIVEIDAIVAKLDGTAIGRKQGE